MRADRLLSLLWILRARGSITAGAAAQELGVSTRTVLRDVEALSAAGVPVYCTLGRHGGIHLDPGFRTDVTGLTAAESGALFAVLATAGADDLGLRACLDSALRKVAAALPGPAKEAADLVADRVIVDPGGWLPPLPVSHLGRLHQAVMEDRRVRIGYRSKGSRQMSEYRIDTYGLVCSAGTWYLIGARGERVRFYHLARITTVELLDEPSARPADLDLKKLWEASKSDFRAGFTPLEVYALGRPERLGELFSLAEQVRPPGDPSEPTTPAPVPGYSPVHLRFADQSHAMQVLPDFGPDVLVIEPADLREKILARAAATTQAYARWAADPAPQCNAGPAVSIAPGPGESGGGRPPPGA